MLVHGDATCAPLWKRVAEGLVGRGCRVCVIGRSSRVVVLFSSFRFWFVLENMVCIVKPQAFQMGSSNDTHFATTTTDMYPQHPTAPAD
jgi:hypothetical protein